MKKMYLDEKKSCIENKTGVKCFISEEENMKPFYKKFRIMLLTLALGLASIPFFRMIHERWTEIRANVPQVESDAPFIVFPYEMTKDTTLTGNRDLSLYEFGGDYILCDNDKSLETQKCEVALEKGRKLIWKNWNDKKQSYFTINDKKKYIFIEPGSDGKWHIITAEEYGPQYSWGKMIENADIESLKFIRDYEDGKRKLCFSWSCHGQWCF